MESLFKACSSLIEHKRVCLSWTPEEAFMKYIYTEALAFWQMLFCIQNTTALFWRYVVCLSVCLSVCFLAWVGVPSGSALSWFHVSCQVLVCLTNISFTSMFSLHLNVGVFFIHVMFTVIKLPLKSAATERSATVRMTLHIPGILWCLRWYRMFLLPILGVEPAQNLGKYKKCLCVLMKLTKWKHCKYVNTVFYYSCIGCKQ